MYYPALIVFVITLIPLFFTKYLFVADWERPKDLNGIDARMIIFWGYIFGMVLPIGLVAFRGYIIQKYESPIDIFIVRSDICYLYGLAFSLIRLIKVNDEEIMKIDNKTILILFLLGIIVGMIGKLNGWF